MNLLILFSEHSLLSIGYSIFIYDISTISNRKSTDDFEMNNLITWKKSQEIKKIDNNMLINLSNYNVKI